ncbi:protocatechuate 3,4-dioxygenase subunit alpha [Streptomyces sp. NBC_01716]|uniref:protocatechuate 3,4-dioxygenase subunit alpha n=1 Tax=Streptomyces sp. NBC_01716 TaxID=2975917 RepID=UPI002E37B555|nr:protocatechuate 3,4-dioxygenase subunit alpha [Streptomyces sp. NBC_01716]
MSAYDSAHGTGLAGGATPSHTVGPFYGYALPFPGGGDMAPVGHPDAISVHGRVYDGAGAPVPDALLELWQPDPAGEPVRLPGSMRRDQVTGGHAGRDGVTFTGWGRVATDADGRWAARTLRPGARPGHAPYLSVCVFARGLTRHLYTRLYVPQDAEAGSAGARPADPLLASLDADRRGTLMAKAGPTPGAYRFDIRLQGDEETVFLDFR